MVTDYLRRLAETLREAEELAMVARDETPSTGTCLLREVLDSTAKACALAAANTENLEAMATRAADLRASQAS